MFLVSLLIGDDEDIGRRDEMGGVKGGEKGVGIAFRKEIQRKILILVD